MQQLWIADRRAGGIDQLPGPGPVGDRIVAEAEAVRQSGRSGADSYGLLDGSIGVKAGDGKWQVQLYGTNLTNEHYWTGVASGTETVFRSPGMPSQFGIRGRFQF